MDQSLVFDLELIHKIRLSPVHGIPPIPPRPNFTTVSASSDYRAAASRSNRTGQPLHSIFISRLRHHLFYCVQ